VRSTSHATRIAAEDAQKLQVSGSGRLVCDRA